MQIRSDLVNLVIHAHHLPERPREKRGCWVKEAARQEGISVATASDSFLIERPAHESWKLCPGSQAFALIISPIISCPCAELQAEILLTVVVKRGYSVRTDSPASWCFCSNCEQVKLYSIAYFIILSLVRIDMALWLQWRRSGSWEVDLCTLRSQKGWEDKGGGFSLWKSANLRS